MKKIYILTILSLLMITGCRKATVLKIEFDDVSGLDEKSPLLLNGFNIGSVKGIKVQQTSRIMVEVLLNQKVPLTRDAKFSIASIDLFGSKAIKVENGISQSGIDYNQVQLGQREKNLINDSTVVNIIDKVAGKFSPATKLDSIENELKKLNKNIEQLKNQK